MENEKYLFVVSGAAGTGKDSVVKALREALSLIHISEPTRPY